jgi:hypothetical protein
LPYTYDRNPSHTSNFHCSVDSMGDGLYDVAASTSTRGHPMVSSTLCQCAYMPINHQCFLADACASIPIIPIPIVYVHISNRKLVYRLTVLYYRRIIYMTTSYSILTLYLGAAPRCMMSNGLSACQCVCQCCESTIISCISSSHRSRGLVINHWCLISLAEKSNI